jgi:hypothetical protein
MKKILFILILLSLVTFALGQNSASATYSGGNVTLTYQMDDPQPPANSQNALPLTINLPIGARITSIDVEYDIHSFGAYDCASPRSYLKCTSTGGYNGSYESSMASVAYQNSPVTIHYSRTGLDLANSFFGGGDINFELHCFDLSAQNPNLPGYSYLVNNTFKVTVYYSDEFDFVEFSAQNEDIGEISLSWVNNNTPGNVLIATNSVDDFTQPLNGSTYTAGDMLGSAEIIYFGNAGQFLHENVSESTQYFYKAWACDASLNYDAGLTANLFSSGNVEFPIVANFDDQFPEGWTANPVSVWGNWNISATSNNGATPHEGSGMAIIRRDQMSANYTADLITNPIMFPGLNYSLSLWVYRITNSAYNDLVSVYVNNTSSIENATLVGTVKLQYNLAPVEASGGWYNYSFDLSQYGVGLGTAKYIIIRGVTSGRSRGSVCIDNMKIENLPDFPENEGTTIDGVTIQPNVNLYYNYNINADNPLITSLPNYENLGNKKVIGLTGYDNDIDVQVTAPAGSWYARIYYGGAWHTADPAFIAETDVDRTFTFQGVDFTAKDSEVFIFMNDGDDFTLPVELSSFNAIATADNFAQISWETASESNLLGYNIYRSETENQDDALRVTATMITASNQAMGDSYSYTDDEVEMNTTYNYWLQSTDFDGTSQMFGPVTIKISDQEDHDINDVILGTELYGNYPNPFNPETTISYSISQAQHVRLEVYNMRGQLVKTLLNKQVETANTRLNVVWNGKDNNNNQVSSGIYLYKLITDDYSKSNKMILMK